MEIQTQTIAYARLIARDLAASRPAHPARIVARPTAAALLRRFLEARTTPRDDAWAAAYLRQDVHIRLDAEPLDPTVLGVVSCRQAWQFQVLPLRRERGVLVLVTTEAALIRAARFATRVCEEPAVLLVAEGKRFRQFLSAYYPFAGVESLLGE